MNRLPGGDRTTQRSEWAVFLSLGLAGVAMIALAVAQMTGLMAGGDRLNAALANQPEPLSATTPANLNGPATAPAAAHQLPNGRIGSARESKPSLLLR